MLVSAPRRQPITHLLATSLVFFACSKKADAPAPANESAGSAAPGSAAPGSAAAGSAAVGSAASGSAASGSTATYAPVPASARTGLARRCVLGGDPLASDCVGGGEGIAFDKAGTLYVVDNHVVRRYARAEGDGCHFEPSGEPIEMPPDNPRPQKLGGTVYMRSGGAAWHLARTGPVVYAHDFLGGLVRVDRGKAEPVCNDIFGFKSIVQLGKRLLLARNGIEELKVGKRCKAVPAKLDGKPRGELFVIGDTLYAGSGSQLQRYDGGKPVEAGAGAKLCYVKAVTACGDGACVLDSNCMQLVQLAADGTVQRTLDDDKLFGTRPWSVATATTDDAGDVFILARHRDKTNGKEICEAAIYELPAAAFAR